jgi:hypothetical protein
LEDETHAYEVLIRIVGCGVKDENAPMSIPKLPQIGVGLSILVMHRRQEFRWANMARL